jgi:hypothetical protein
MYKNILSLSTFTNCYNRTWCVSSSERCVSLCWTKYVNRNARRTRLQNSASWEWAANFSPLLVSIRRYVNLRQFHRADGREWLSEFNGHLHPKDGKHYYTPPFSIELQKNPNDTPLNYIIHDISGTIRKFAFEKEVKCSFQTRFIYQVSISLHASTLSST